MPSLPDDATTRNGNLAVVKQIMARISQGYFDGIMEFVADDFAFELPFGPEGLPPSFDRATFDLLQKTTFARFSTFSLTYVEHHPALDPNTVVVEYRSDAVVANNGRPYRNRYIGVFRFRDGKVVFWREFYNPEIATRAFAED